MTPRAPHPKPDDHPQEYVGLPLAAAEERARARGWEVVRVIAEDEAVLTAEYRDGRINLQAPGGQVTRCWFG